MRNVCATDPRQAGHGRKVSPATKRIDPVLCFPAVADRRGSILLQGARSEFQRQDTQATPVLSISLSTTSSSIIPLVCS